MTMAFFQSPNLSPNVSAQIEVTWQMAVESLSSNNGQILVNSTVYRLIGMCGVEQLKMRLSGYLGNVPVIATKDLERNVIRIQRLVDAKAHRDMITDSPAIPATSSTQLFAATTPATRDRTSCAFGKSGKIPRPPNAFILYRQHWHPHYKQYNKDMHNNEISKAIGARWATEAEEVKEKYKRLASDLKAKHAAKYPDYQYAPRKPGEKKRRMTAKKLERLRQASSAQEVASLSSPDDFSTTSGCTPSAETPKSDQSGDGPQSNESIVGSFNGRSLASLSPPPIMSQEDGQYNITLPATHDDIQGEITGSIGTYQEGYIDVAQNIDADVWSAENILQSHSNSSVDDKHAEWESLIDWHALNYSISVTENMATSLNDLTAEQAPGPDPAYPQR